MLLRSRNTKLEFKSYKSDNTNFKSQLYENGHHSNDESTLGFTLFSDGTFPLLKTLDLYI